MFDRHNADYHPIFLGKPYRPSKARTRRWHLVLITLLAMVATAMMSGQVKANTVTHAPFATETARLSPILPALEKIASPSQTTEASTTTTQNHLAPSHRHPVSEYQQRKISRARNSWWFLMFCFTTFLFARALNDESL